MIENENTAMIVETIIFSLVHLKIAKKYDFLYTDVGTCFYPN